MLAYRYPIPQ